ASLSTFRIVARARGRDRPVSEGVDLEHTATGPLFCFAALSTGYEHCEARGVHAGVRQLGEPCGELGPCLRTSRHAGAGRGGQRMGHLHFPRLHDPSPGGRASLLRPPPKQRTVARVATHGTPPDGGAVASGIAGSLATPG